MERILRGLFQVGQVPDAIDCLKNWTKFQEHSVDFQSVEDRSIYEYLNTFYGSMSAPPDFVIVREYFEKEDKIEVVSRLDEVKSAQPYIGTNYLAIVKAEEERQLTKNLIMLFRDASIIAEHGRNIDKPLNGKKILKGVPDAVDFVYDRLHDFTHIECGEKLEGVITDDAEELMHEYEIVEKMDKYAGRNLFGLEPVDVICRGHRMGEYWIHTAFAGELKCVVGSSTIYDHKAKKRRTVEEIFNSGEAPTVTALYKEGKLPKLIIAEGSKIIKNGVRPVFELRLESGKKTTATGNHKFLAIDGWKELSEIHPEDWLAVPSPCGGISWERIICITPKGLEMTYDLEVPEHHSFVVDDIISHNTSLALNYAYNNTYVYGKNIFYAILEMPYKQLRRQLYVIHSSHGKFITDWWEEDAKLGIPPEDRYLGLDYRKVRDGELSPKDKERLKKVAQDYKATSKGKMFVWRPKDESTIIDIRKKAEMFHNKYGCDGIVVDHLGLVKPRYRTSDFVTTQNAVVREGRLLALNFARGRGVPVLALFQMNRQGKLRADKNDGFYDMSAISYSNECEKSADVITWTYLNDQLRKEGKFYMGNLKNRDNPIFSRMTGKILWMSKRMRAIEPGLSVNIDNDNTIVSAGQHISQLTVEDLIY